MRFATTTAIIALALSLGTTAPDAHATEDEFNVSDGTWLGTVRAPRGPLAAVSVVFRGESFVVVDLDRVTVGEFSLQRFGPGGKDGRSTFKGDWRLKGGLLRSGKPFRTSRGDAPVAFTVWPDGRAVFCHPIAGYTAKDGEVRVPAGASMPHPHVRCLDLTRATAAVTPDEGVPPVPARAWEDAPGGCFTQCVEANQMRAVAPAVISADCNAQCTPNAPPKRFEPGRRAP